MKNIPYIKIKQKKSEFFLLKLDLNTLKRTVNFHFRDPYLDEEDYNNADVLKAKEYMEVLAGRGINITKSSSDDGGIQRRLGLSRVLSIQKFIDEDSESILPGSVILSYNSYETDPLIVKLENKSKDYGTVLASDFSDNSIIVIDGQHRLAGLLTSEIDEDFEIPISLFINSGLSESSKLFRDINGNQKPVNRSFIYDLYSNIETEEYLIEAKLHKVCKFLNENPKSPFYRQIKMLGTGSGSISQSFFIEYGKDALKKLGLLESSAQEILELFYNYFKIVQQQYQEYWPVPLEISNLSDAELRDFGQHILTESKLAKTNGVGALFLIYPYLHDLEIPFNEALSYFDIKLTNTISGSGRSVQSEIAKSTLKKLINKGYNIKEDRFTKSIFEER